MEEFRIRPGSFWRFAAAFAGPLLLFFLVCLLLGAIATGSTPLGTVIGLACAGALLAVVAAKHRRLVTGTVVRFTDEAVELSDAYGFRVRLRWPDITRIDAVDTRVAAPGAIGRRGGLRVRARPLRATGLVGWGERETPARIPRWMRDRLAAAPVDPVTGRPEVAIPLGELDPLWERGPMGAWIRRHRPDLAG
ncbi:hypothetical protein OIE66_04425 [Nonomuraea sp. NBC_01738]|uniref:hypothetical protein n=1 Tax=Nonomuraea sp. NBC_01738 TaxID=2976003 RepID=UPI002E0F5362|nr:hypothetical protein OIE66_04425 [Nonomuraea sp. NBC_01738]